VIDMRRSAFVVVLVFLIFFVISLITNIMGALIPNLRDDFHLSLGLAGFLPFSFFVAYLASIPAALAVERFRAKPVLVASFVLSCGASLLFATHPSYGVALASFLMLGVSMAMLQVPINPLLRVAGGEEHFAFYSVMAQLVFGLASFLSPRLYTSLVQGLDAAGQGATPSPLIALLRPLVPPALPWVSLYWVFAGVTLLMVVTLSLVRLPTVELKEDERAGALATHRELLRNPTVLLFFAGIFAYVGTEQGVGNWISEFLKLYHGYDPVTDGANAVSWFWGLMTAGCGVGLVLLKLFDSRRVLVVFASAAIVTLSAALFGPRTVSYYAFMVMGFCASVMWSIVFSLALNSVPKHHGTFSGILCTGIIGGAVLPLVIGALGDLVGLRLGMTVLYLTLGYILSIGLWARPLIKNATLGDARS
jgi:fucose permease